MFEFALWVLFGAITGWIGSLMTRTDNKGQIGPFVIIGIASAVLGGFITRNLATTEVVGALSWNPISLTMAFFTAIVSVVALSFFGKTSSS